jgi:nucleotide-binding universal stress UspA family protein
MFQKVVLAYDASAESERALASAIRLAKSPSAELRTVTVMADLPVYSKSMERVGGLASVL